MPEVLTSKCPNTNYPNTKCPNTNYPNTNVQIPIVLILNFTLHTKLSFTQALTITTSTHHGLSDPILRDSTPRPTGGAMVAVL